MLEVGSDLVAPPQVEEEGEGVDVSSSAQEHCQLGGDVVKEESWSKTTREIKHWPTQFMSGF